MEAMNAVVVKKFGSSDQLDIQSVPVPTKLGNEEILVRVHASSVNPVDVKMIEGLYSYVLWRKLPARCGFDVSGVVERVGTGVTKFKPGDEVFGMASPRRIGTWAELAILKERELCLKPKSISHTQAATLPMVALTSFQALVYKCKFHYGHSVLVLGGAGGTGTMAIQIAKAMGASKVYATCSSKNKEFLEQELGVDRAIDYTTEDFAEILKNDPVDIIYDCVGKREEWSKAYPIIKKDGHFITIQPGSLGKGLLATTFTKGKLLVVQDIHFHIMMTTGSGKDLETISRLVDEGKLKPIVQEVVPIENVRHAVDQVNSGHTRGKIAIEVVKN
jgi:NADPH:quinone reductase-like Zn-dependent oxidoreductase